MRRVLLIANSSRSHGSPTTNAPRSVFVTGALCGKCQQSFEELGRITDGKIENLKKRTYVLSPPREASVSSETF